MEVLEGRAASLRHLASSSFGVLNAPQCRYKQHPGIPPLYQRIEIEAPKGIGPDERVRRARETKGASKRMNSIMHARVGRSRSGITTIKRSQGGHPGALLQTGQVGEGCGQGLARPRRGTGTGFEHTVPGKVTRTANSYTKQRIEKALENYYEHEFHK